ncbi:MAG: hypothetical protein K5873_05450 [Treponema sp.]|nr:hypothetical protein [Treponema sp.]
MKFRLKFSKINAFLFSVMIFFSSSPLFASEENAGEEKVLSYLRELTFEITRYNMTGLTIMAESIPLASISKFGSLLMSRPKIKESCLYPIYLVEYYNPEKIGLIDASFTSKDLFSVNESSIQEEDGKLTDPSNLSEKGLSQSVNEVDWVDLLLHSLDASKGGQGKSLDINDGSHILEMLENSSSRGIDAAEEEKSESDLPQEYTYARNDGSLRRFAYDGEQFTSWMNGENTVLVNYYGSKLIRKNYDSLYRLTQSEKFKTSSTAKNTVLECLIKYEYEGESNIPAKSIEEKYSEKKRIESTYDEKGRYTCVNEGHYEEREIKNKKTNQEKTEKDSKNEDIKEKQKETVFLDDKKTSYKYDDEGRIIEEEKIFWNYKTHLSGRISTSTRIIKNLFDYSAVNEENKLPPNLDFYEDGQLHLQRRYTASSDYSEKLFFDGGFSVEVFYENGIKKMEIIYLNDKEQRRREFEY